MLHVLNKHPRDIYIVFEEIAHKYTVKGDSNYTSVTTFIKKFFNEFNADAVISKMQRFGSFAKKYGSKTAQEVKDEWKNAGLKASTRGTALHKYIENFYNGIDEPVDELNYEIDMFYDFVRQTRALTPYRTEWYIWDEKHKIAGSIDMLFRPNPIQYPNVVAIYDWKCSKEIKSVNRYEKGRSPIEHLDDCNKNHYSLQLNLYKYILETNYNLSVAEMYLVIIHQNRESFGLIPIADMQKEIRLMLKTYSSSEGKTSV